MGTNESSNCSMEERGRLEYWWSMTLCLLCEWFWCGAFYAARTEILCVWKQTWKARLMLNFVMSTPLIPTISSPVCVQAQYRGLVNRIRHLCPSCSNMSLCSCSSSQAQLFHPVTQYWSLQFHFLHPHLTPGHQDEPALRYFTCGYMFSFMHCSDQEPQSHLRHAVVLPS